MEPYEGLDIDDSDLQSFFRKCNSNTNFIPGPNRNQVILVNRESDEPKNTQEFVNQIADASYQCDFNSNP